MYPATARQLVRRPEAHLKNPCQATACGQRVKPCGTSYRGPPAAWAGAASSSPIAIIVAVTRRIAHPRMTAPSPRVT
jgi:hypothetical protein